MKRSEFARSNPSQALLLAAGLVSGAVPAFAQGTQGAAAPAVPASAVAATQLDKVEVTGRHYDNAIGSSDAASQGTIRAELLKSRPALRPGEVLEFVPGVIVTQHSGDGKANQYFLRGFNLDHGTDFATFVNGLPVNMPTHAPRPGLLRPELPDPRTGGPHRVPQGPVLRARRRLRFRRLGRHRLPHAARRALRRSDAGRSAAFAARWPAAPATSRRASQLLGAIELQRNDGPWTVPEALRKVNGVLTLSGGTRGAGLERQPDGLRRALDRDRPGPAAPDRRRQLRRPAVRPLRFARPQRRAATPAAAACPASGTATPTAGTTQVVGLRHRLPARAVLQLHLRAGAPGRRRPVRAAGRAHASTAWPPATPSTTRSAGLAARSEFGLQLRHDRIARRPVRHAGAPDARHRRATTACARRCSALYGADRGGADALAAQHRRPARRPGTLQGRQPDAARPTRAAPATTMLSPKLSLIAGPVGEDRVLLQRRPRLPQQRRARHHRHASTRRPATRSTRCPASWLRAA